MDTCTVLNTSHAQQIIGAFKRLRWACPDCATHQGLEMFEPFLRTTSHIINFGDDRLKSQPTPPPQHMDKVLNDTHLMFKDPPFLVDPNKWCHNNVETRDVHAALKPLHGSQRRTQIVKCESKATWSESQTNDIRPNSQPFMAHCNQIAHHAQTTHRCKCGKRMTVDHVHFEC